MSGKPRGILQSEQIQTLFANTCVNESVTNYKVKVAVTRNLLKAHHKMRKRF
jgi:hypothetical protein